MFALVFSACLLNAPDVCREQTLGLVAFASPRSCLFRAQPLLARWASQRDGWRVTRWKCESVDRRKLHI